MLLDGLPIMIAGLAYATNEKLDKPSIGKEMARLRNRWGI